MFFLNPFLFPVYFNDTYCLPAIDFETFKKSGAIARAIGSDPRLGAMFDVEDPANRRFLDRASTLIENYVDTEYRSAIISGKPPQLAGSNGLGWDPALYHSVLHSTAGILRAIDFVAHGGIVASSLSSGMHHASPSRGAGFCTVNSLALGALFAADLGLNVVILDFDAHCGGGTEAFLRAYSDDAPVTHIDLSLVGYDTYEPRSQGTWSRISSPDTYLDDVDEALRHAIAGEPDIVIYNAGVDIWPAIDKEVVRERDERVARTLAWAGAGCVVVMAGGYGAESDVVSLHLSTLKAFAESKDAFVTADSMKHRRGTNEPIRWASRYDSSRHALRSRKLFMRLMAMQPRVPTRCFICHRPQGSRPIAGMSLDRNRYCSWCQQIYDNPTGD